MSSDSGPVIVTIQTTLPSPSPSPTATPAPTPLPKTPVAGILNGDTTWTKAGSPYGFSGPAAIPSGATLTIEPGTIVNFNGYYLQVNGTLRATGSTSDPIRFNDAEIACTSVSNGWNDQTGTGNIIENAIIDGTSIASRNALKINNNTIYGGQGVIYAGNASIISNNIITGYPEIGDVPAAVITNIRRVNPDVYSLTYYYTVTVGASSKVNNNTIMGSIYADNASQISNNDLTSALNTRITSSELFRIFTWGNSSIQNNKVTGINAIGIYIPRGRLSGILIAEPFSTTTISNNIINGTIGGVPATISGNTITGGATSVGWGGIGTSGDPASSMPPVNIYSPTCTFTNNTINGTQGAAVTIQSSGSADFYSNTINGSISGGSIFSKNIINGGAVFGCSKFTYNTINGAIITTSPAPLISNNMIKNGFIRLYEGNASISDNTIWGYIDVGSGNSTIERNIIGNSTTGITVETNAKATIRNCTITNNSIAISIQSATPIPSITYNNLQNNTQTIVLSTAANVNAANNWWGTTNAQAINQTIFDFKNDFNLGIVTFVPFLNNANPQATPNILTPDPTPTPTPTPTQTPAPTSPPVIPELATFAVLSIVALASMLVVAVAVLKRKKTLG